MQQHNRHRSVQTFLTVFFTNSNQMRVCFLKWCLLFFLFLFFLHSLVQYKRATHLVSLSLALGWKNQAISGRDARVFDLALCGSLQAKLLYSQV